MKNNNFDYVELTITTTHLGSDLVSDLLLEFSEMGVSVYDVQDVLDLEKEGKSWDYVDENVKNADNKVLVKGYIPIAEYENQLSKINARLNQLKDASQFDLGDLTLSSQYIDGEYWREQWKENFKPIHINNVVIVPEWIEYQPKEDEICVYLDSNMAFGTGEHETTSMCVEYLQKYVKANSTVLDVGCGSGILGITALKLNAKKVIMTDIDEQAVKSSKHNMELNGETRGEVLLKNLLDDNSVKGDVIVCNIMAEVLIAFAPYIKNNLNSNGIVILSGILADRLEKVKSAYIDNGFKFIEQKIKGEWSALVLEGK